MSFSSAMRRRKSRTHVALFFCAMTAKIDVALHGHFSENRENGGKKEMEKEELDMQRAMLERDRGFIKSITHVFAKIVKVLPCGAVVDGSCNDMLYELWRAEEETFWAVFSVPFRQEIVCIKIGSDPVFCVSEWKTYKQVSYEQDPEKVFETVNDIARHLYEYTGDIIVDLLKVCDEYPYAS